MLPCNNNFDNVPTTRLYNTYNHVIIIILSTYCKDHAMLLAKLNEKKYPCKVFNKGVLFLKA